MGACVTHLKREMQAPPPHPNIINADQLGPRRPDPYTSPKTTKQVYEIGNGNGNILKRIETPSAIPGLTFDHAGRPVWREENAVKTKTEHREET